MGWDRKARGSPQGYYYRSVRLPDRPGPVKVYLVRGPDAQAAAVEVQRRRADRAAAHAEVARWAGLDQLVTESASLAATLAAAALVAAGWHRHKGEWRRQRMT